ncbi:glycosyltransferase [uncultured Veillonella sp.]|uniref:glycosyltransferase n=1 Tax=uncultured Veillonella sp. TaxID=159268 RepID=UPI0025F87C81|nr:glycosyltransferase [uncultured Veillonella sp.]MDY3973339.1 glycosyltransferase [Veillonella caviae]
MTRDSLPVKVLQVGMTRNLGGLETYLMQQFDNLDKNKVVYDFVNITNEYEIVFADKIKTQGSKIFGICSRHKNPLKHYWQWYKLLSKEGPNYKAIVLNTNSLEYIFPLVIGKITGIPVRVIHSHSSGFENKIGVFRRLLVFLNRMLMKWSATGYFACSQLAGEWMFEKQQPFTVINNAINAKDLAYDESIRNEVRNELALQDNFVVGHVGRFVYSKDHEFLINIFAEVYKQNNKSRLLLIGDYVDDDTFYKQAQEQVRSLGLEAVVLFLGMRHDVNRLMQGMDCFVLPSRFEGLPLVGIEAQASGLYCVFSNTISEELRLIDGRSAFLDKSLDKRIWAKTIVDSNSIKRIDTTQQIAQAGYDIEVEVNKVMDFYLK